MFDTINTRDRTRFTCAIEPPVLRPPSEMMSTARVAGAANNPLSFSRTAMQELIKGKWKIEKDRFDLDADGRGEVLYRLVNGNWQFHFFLISNKLPEDQKLDRNFAGTWEAMGTLCEGPWTPEREALLRREIPKQVAGRADYDTLVYVRGNRSGRLFQHVIDSLAQGVQPDAQQIANVGYILRTTAFIGNGQLGTRPLAGYADDHPMRRPYHAQIWAAFLLREYVFDLVDHMARAQNPAAVRLSADIRRYLGLGNSAATGLVPFIATHPMLIHRWVQTQETAAAMARAKRADNTDASIPHFIGLLNKAIQYFNEDDAPDDGIFVPAHTIAAELTDLIPLASELHHHGTLNGHRDEQPWVTLHDWLSQHASADTVEIYNAILLDVYPDIANQFIDSFVANERFDLDPAMTVTQLDKVIDQEYSWVDEQALEPDSDYYFWYRAEAAPFDLRRGERDLVPELEFETPMDTTRLIRQLKQELSTHKPDTPVADVLLNRPDLRRIIRRAQSIAQCPYGELRTNLLKKTLSPFGPVRFILAFYGMEKFDGAAPKVVRGAFLQGAPIAEDVEHGRDGSWPFPLIPTGGDAENTPAADRIASIKKPDPGPLPGNPHPTVSAHSDTLISAPVELQRLIQTALHGAGLELGIAEDAAETALIHKALTHNNLEQLLDLVKSDLTGQAAMQQLYADDITLRLDAGRAAALSVAATALDCANSRALSNNYGLGITIVKNASHADMLTQLALRSAERNLLGLVLWKTGQSYGFALSGPGTRHPWLLHAELSHIAPLYSALSQPQDGADNTDNHALIDLAEMLNIPSNAIPTNMFDHLTDALTQPDHPQVSADTATDGFLVASIRHGSVDADRLFEGVKTWQTRHTDPGIRSASLHAAETMYEKTVQWNRRGLPISKTSFDALSQAARNILVPDAEEHRLRPTETIDPLKIF